MAPTAPTSGSVLSSDPDLHLLRRASFGPTTALLAEIRARGSAGWLDDQLHPERIDDSAMDGVLGLWPSLTYTLAQLNAMPERRKASNDLVQATLARQLWSRRQLFEVMVEFWTNHFNIVAPHPSSYTSKPMDDRTVIRPNALGRFDTMLLASARSAAMMSYLDNESSQGSEPNENYGRELMQLHTCGPEAGYTEDDVKNSALILTGRSTDGAAAFLYRPDYHYVGFLRIMGWSSANASATGGLATSDGYLRYLARLPQTARHLATKLAIRFVSDDPPSSLIDRMAEAYLDSATAIVPMLQELLDSPEFADSVGAKTRRPAESVVATMRALAVEPPKTSAKAVGNLVSDCGGMGQAPMGCFPPPGYPDQATGWWSVGGTLSLCNLKRSMARGYPSTLSRPELLTRLAGPALTSYGEMVDRLTMALTSQLFRADHRDALFAYSGLSPTAPYDERTAQKWLPDLTELVLDSPYLVLR